MFPNFDNLRSLAKDAKNISKSTFRELKEALKDDASSSSSPSPVHRLITPRTPRTPASASASPRTVTDKSNSRDQSYVQSRVGSVELTDESPSLRPIPPSVSSLSLEFDPGLPLSEFWQRPLIAACLVNLKTDVSSAPDSAIWREILVGVLNHSALERALSRDKAELSALLKQQQRRAENVSRQQKLELRKAVDEVEQLREVKSLFEEELLRLREETRQPAVDETIVPLQQAVEDMQREHENVVRRLRSDLTRAKTELSELQETSKRDSAQMVKPESVDAKEACEILREEVRSLKDDMNYLVNEREKHFVEAENFVDRRLMAMMLDRIKNADSPAIHDEILSQAISIIGTTSDRRQLRTSRPSEDLSDQLLQFIEEELGPE